MTSLETKLDDFPTVLTNLVQLPFYGSLAFYGEHLQRLTEQGLRPYDWFTGHTSDFFALAAVTSSYTIGYGIFNKDLSKLSPIIAGTLFTASEFADKNFDVQDVILYWLGAYTAVYTANKLKPACKKIIDKMKKLFHKEVIL